MNPETILALLILVLFLVIPYDVYGQQPESGDSGSNWYRNNAEFTLRDSTGTTVTIRIRHGWNAHYGSTTEIGFVRDSSGMKVHALMNIELEMRNTGRRVAGRQSSYKQMLEDHENRILWWRVADDFYGNPRFSITNAFRGDITIDSRRFPMPQDLLKALYSLPEPEPVEE